MILIDRIKNDPSMGALWKQMPSGLIPLRIHHDVVKLALELAARDGDKLVASANQLFMPAGDCWFEWPMEEGDMGMLFFGSKGSVQCGHGLFHAWRHKGEEDGTTTMPLAFDLETGRIEVGQAIVRLSNYYKGDPIAMSAAVAKMKPVFLAFLALINSPKIVRRDPAKLERLNRKRQSAGRYTFHPHHVVRLNVDRKMIRVGASTGGDGATRALHFVRAHLRLWEGRYILVQPHWRGDPQVGIVKPAYEVDRSTSRWRD